MSISARPDAFAVRAEDCILVPRQRYPWEAMDLAFPLWRYSLRQAWSVYLLLWCVSLSLLLIVTMQWQLPQWSLLVIWWLKPLYDFFYMTVYSRALFQQITTPWHILRALPSYFRNGLLLYLTVYRLDPFRAINLPVRQLEGLRGRLRAKRARMLRRRTSGWAMAALSLCSALESWFLFGVAVLMYIIFPEYWPDIAAMSPSLMQQLTWAFVLLYHTAVSIVEPVYAATGFLLYLNRRTQLEAWDLELQLPQPAQLAHA